jgi:hypothetical protein
MVFKIGEKKHDTSFNGTNTPVPLLPPPPSPSKKYKEASDDASSSSSATDNDDDNDPLAMFRSKSVKKTTNEKQGKNLITDWDEDETKTNENDEEEEDRVCLMSVCMYLLLSCLSYKFIQGRCCVISILFLFIFYLFHSSKKKFKYHHDHLLLHR